METYINLGGNSGVKSYEIGADYIDVLFYGNSRIYRYSYKRAGEKHVEQMKLLAIRGSGLNSYIMKYVKFLYD